MSLTNPNKPVTEARLQEFYHKLLPYMGGSIGGSGHTIEDNEGTALTQRDTLQFGEGFSVEDDSDNEKTVITPNVMQSGDMDDVITPLPSVGNKMPVLFDESGAERVVGWYKYANGTKKPVYQKNFYLPSISLTKGQFYTIPNSTISNIDLFISMHGTASDMYSNNISLPFINTADVNQGVTFEYLSGGISLRTHGGYVNFTKICITIQYTKTTDTPNT